MIVKSLPSAAVILTCAACESSAPTGAETKYEDDFVEFRVSTHPSIPGENEYDTLYLLAVKPDRHGGTRLELSHVLTTTKDGAVTACSTMIERDGELRELIGQAGYVRIITTDGPWTLYDLDKDGGMDIMMNPNRIEDSGCACLFHKAGDWVRGTHIGSEDGTPRVYVGDRHYEFAEGRWREASDPTTPATTGAEVTDN